jgi:hypothetical protein
LSDRVAIGVLTSAFPASLVDSVLAATGRVEQRSRLLPARLVVYFVLAMCLFSGQGYEEVARLLTEGLRQRRWRAGWTVPSTAAIWKARSRLGVEPVKELFATVCHPVANRDTRGAFYRNWRLAAVDGTTFDLPDTQANVEAFGRPPRSGRGEQNVGYPQIRMVGLVECGTHVVFAAAIGPLRTGEQPWPVTSSSRFYRACSFWPTAASSAWACGKPQPRPGRTCCGGFARTLSWPWSSSSQMAHTSAKSSTNATSTTLAKGCGCAWWSTPSPAATTSTD